MPYLPKRTQYLLLAISLICHALAEDIRLDYNGETQHNVLRHSVVLSGLNTTFGKMGSSLLSRAVVSKGGIWSSIDHFTQQIFKEPNTLDWYIADIGSDGDPHSITVQGMFSCIDHGFSSSVPISWYFATGFSKNLSTEKGPDGFKKSPVGQGSSDDITEQCLNGRHENRDDFVGRKTAVHLDKHRGSGVSFIDSPVGAETSIVEDEYIFNRLWKLRSAKDPPTVIVWDEKSGIGVADGLPFESGFKVWPTEDLPTGRTLDHNVHMIPTAALSAHFGFRLQETRVARGESRTSNLLLLLTVWSTGLAILLAVWIVGKAYSDILVERSKQMQKEHVNTIVQGMDGWSISERAMLFGHLAGVTILAAPVAQAVVEGNIDPRVAYEVTSGTSVFYSDARDYLTGDTNNSIAGAVFTCTAWITVRPLDSGFVAALALSSVFILVFALFLAMQVTKKSSETMRRSRLRFSGFSPWKLHGWLLLKLKSQPGRNLTSYNVFVRLRKDASCALGKHTVEDQAKEIALMGSETWRARANTYYYRRPTRDRDSATRTASRNAMHDLLQSRHGCGCVALFARVTMDDRYRCNATIAHTTPYGDAQPREWEYVRRGAGCESIEWYRTNGQFPEDGPLLLTRLGLLKYAKHIAEVRYCEDTDITSISENDEDGVKCIIVVPQSKEVTREFSESFVDNEDGYPNIWRMDDGRTVCLPFEKQLQPEEADVEWLGGHGGKYYTHYDSGNIDIRYFLADRESLVWNL